MGTGRRWLRFTRSLYVPPPGLADTVGRGQGAGEGSDRLGGVLGTGRRAVSGAVFPSLPLGARGRVKLRSLTRPAPALPCPEA